MNTDLISKALLSKNLIHMFIRISAMPNVLATVVCRIDANFGLVVTKGRSIVKTE